MDDALTLETLDPENWDEMRTLAYQMIDDAFSPRNAQEYLGHHSATIS
jgi:hypothetical protein